MILVTGATGFIGSALLRELRRSFGESVRGTARGRAIPGDASHGIIRVYALSRDTSWQQAVCGVRVVVHTAARVHDMSDPGASPHEECRATDIEGTLTLARQAAQAGVRRFLFLSSAKVNGSESPEGEPFSPEDAPQPVCPYGRCKAETEARLLQIARHTGMEVVIIRPPLVYGPGVKANFRRLMSYVYHGMPLPVASLVRNRRSYLALPNLIDFIEVCVRHPNAANHTFMVSDYEDLSTVQLVKRIGAALGRPARLVGVPPWLLDAGAGLVRRRDVVRRLTRSFQLDVSKTRERLGWRPRITVDEGLALTAMDFLGRSGQ